MTRSGLALAVVLGLIGWLALYGFVDLVVRFWP
jgi:hypothetical protein